ncbi:glycine N-methyltransferase [Coccinella septempunctata]|uniref:glycine N-methyltransferase n=1 Tax=Coccinella septempunctata TaxID=41139 RepID=UPI001D08FAF6|nr:glycine N-methyltransferase [Coccinella septempunctata]
MAENSFRTRSLGTAVEGVRDQYADGKAAKVWEIFIGDQSSRTKNYRNFLVDLLRKKGCKRVLDVACGTGVDSIMLLEEGFDVVSIDASDKMLKYALKARWNRRKEPAFDNWIIEEANWLTLSDDIEQLIGGGFDAVICLGNSFAHMLDSNGDQRDQKKALMNFKKCLRPGGILLIDHRNYDDAIDTGYTSPKSIYYNSNHMIDIKTTVMYTSGKPSLVILDYFLDTSSFGKNDFVNEESISEFRLSYYPHRLKVFNKMLLSAFGEDAYHEIYGDFKSLNEIENPAFYIHFIEKSN